ncbi:putative MFS transporter [Lindgomyces ingoldianus]|uniref:MFS transporter n=1 Tax=Lindgomyces ingoldianus TaxID=673940 RepID=A0ACB6QB65_9PLEO|nr:putative MFS transporter [Lindgomyces ingoldianus]KAF2464161.1 putative MFS transporter [Lindgomyces ingoldianus]
MSLQPSTSHAFAPVISQGDAFLKASLPEGDTKSIEQQQRSELITTVTRNHSTHDPGAATNNTNVDGSSLIQPAPFIESELEEAVQKLSGAAITVIMAPLCLSCFLSALDLTIITPAIPAIVSSFNSVTSYAWIGSAFILASTAITPVWGSVADIWGRKPIMLIALTIFLAGSLICALAPHMDVLIAGRAIQGLGSSGMGTMANVIICDSFSMRDRGLYLAITSLVWAVGCAVGPVIGGSFTTRLTWRWCFWLNLPIGTIVFIVLLCFLKLPSPNTPMLAGLRAIDWTGSALIIGAALMILLGLDFGNVTFPWSSVTVICLIAFGAGTIAIFVINEWKFATNPVVPMRLFSSKSTIAAYMIWAYNFYILIGLSYYLPLYSQSVLGANALESGVHLVPLIVSCSLAAACTGAFIQKTGIYLPITYFSHGLLALGTGLFMSLRPQESLTKLVVFEIITGAGVGMNIDPPLLAAQAVMTVLDTAVIQATMTFIRSLATTVAIVVGGVIFQNQMNAVNPRLSDQLGEQLASKFNGDVAATNVEMIGSLPVGQMNIVKDAYFDALRSVWIMFVVVAGLSLIASFFLRAHHLSDKSKAAVLGVDRMKNQGPQPEGPHTSPSTELQVVHHPSSGQN